MTTPSMPGSSSPSRNRPNSKARKVELGSQIVAGTAGSAFGAAKLRDQHREQYPTRHTASVKHAVHVARARGASPQQAARLAHVLHGAKKPGGSPGFKTLATVVAAGTLATTAHRTQEIQDALERRKHQMSGMAKSAPRRVGPIVRVAVPRNQGIAPKHAAGKPGRHRTVSRMDKVKVQAMIHGPRVHGALESITDMMKAACCTGELAANVPRTAHMAGIGKVRVIGYHGDGKFHVIDPHDSGRVVHRDKLNFHRKKGTGQMAKSAFGIEHSVISKGPGLVPDALARGAGKVAGKTGRALKANPVKGAIAGTAGVATAGGITAAVRKPKTPDVDDGSTVGKSAFFDVAKDGSTRDADRARKFGVSQTAASASRRGFRPAGVAYTTPGARKQTASDTRMNSRVIRQGPHTAENRKTTGRGAKVGSGVGAGVGAAYGAQAMKGGGVKGRLIGAAVGAGSGAGVGALEGAAASSMRRQHRAFARGIDQGLKRGTLTSGHDKKDVGVFGGLKQKS